ncbi:hypothetical protein ACLOAV_008276 [Pseudogymnoascus australis]
MKFLASIVGSIDPRNVPNTGKIRQYKFVIERGTIAPDGVKKNGLLINGQFPGPTIEANWGDMFEITVTNNITSPEEGTTLHWHGLHQEQTPWFDGTPSVTQCPIASGGSFTYKFQASLYGTSWYHSHLSAQYADGLYGAMIIHGPAHADYDYDLGPIFLSDHYHTGYAELVKRYKGLRAVPDSDNNLINGKTKHVCAHTNATTCTPNAGLSKFKFKSGKAHRLRLINSGSDGTQKFTIDGHTMTVIANDYVPVHPYETDVITLGVGQRTDIVVRGTGRPTESFWMRSDISKRCSNTNQPHALAVIHYEKADMSTTPTSQATVYNETNCSNDALTITKPKFVMPPPEPDFTQVIDIDFHTNATGFGMWTTNNQTYQANYNYSLLLLANQGNTSYPDDPQWNVFNFGKSTSIRIVLRSHIPLAHPMHLHGHTFWVVAEGVGEWDGVVTHPENPQRRDTQLLDWGYPSPGKPRYMVIDFLANNPGVWPFHCHVQWHVNGGLSMNIMTRPDLITELQIPPTISQTCRDWSDYRGA